MPQPEKRRKSTRRRKPAKPAVRFDAELFELWVGDVLVKRLDIRASDQIRILAVFQEENWPRRIDDPLPPRGGDCKAHMHSAIHSLNGHQHPPLTIRFFSDGTGQGIRWELTIYN